MASWTGLERKKRRKGYISSPLADPHLEMLNPYHPGVAYLGLLASSMAKVMLIQYVVKPLIGNPSAATVRYCRQINAELCHRGATFEARLQAENLLTLHDAHKLKIFLV